jgi:hypothetical protein
LFWAHPFNSIAIERKSSKRCFLIIVIFFEEAGG